MWVRGKARGAGGQIIAVPMLSKLSCIGLFCNLMDKTRLCRECTCVSAPHVLSPPHFRCPPFSPSPHTHPPHTRLQAYFFFQMTSVLCAFAVMLSGQHSLRQYASQDEAWLRAPAPRRLCVCWLQRSAGYPALAARGSLRDVRTRGAPFLRAVSWLQCARPSLALVYGRHGQATCACLSARCTRTGLPACLPAHLRLLPPPGASRSCLQPPSSCLTCCAPASRWTPLSPI